MWFTAYPYADWTPDKGYNAVFAEVVRHVRSLFQTRKMSSGVEVGSEYWRPFTGRSGSFFFNVNSFVWNQYRDVNGILTPVLCLELRLGRVSGQVATTFPLEITFQAEFPKFPPVFVVTSHPYQNKINQEYGKHHVMEKGLLCIWDAHGYDGNKWNPNTDTIVSAINVALDHLSWHYTTFGW